MAKTTKKTTKAKRAAKPKTAITSPERPTSPEGFLGLLVIDHVTGFRGAVDSIVYMLSGCIQAHVQPPADKEGKLPSGWFLDLDRLGVIGSTAMERTTPDRTHYFSLGSTAVDKITGVQGTLTEKQVHINGCTTYIITTRSKRKAERMLAVDWKRLDISESRVLVPAPRQSEGLIKGGPMRQELGG